MAWRHEPQQMLNEPDVPPISRRGHDVSTMALTSEGTWNVSVVETLEAIEALRPDWERLLEEEPHSVVNAHIDRYCSVIQAYGDSMRPHVIVLQNGGEVRAIVVARLERHAPKITLGRRVSVGRPRRCLTVVHGGLLGCHDDPVRDAAVKALDGELRQGAADLAYLANVIGEGFLDAIRRQIPFHRRSLVPGRALHWRMTIPESLDAFYAQRSSKHRKHLRAYVCDIFLWRDVTSYDKVTYHNVADRR